MTRPPAYHFLEISDEKHDSNKQWPYQSQYQLGQPLHTNYLILESHCLPLTYHPSYFNRITHLWNSMSVIDLTLSLGTQIIRRNSALILYLTLCTFHLATLSMSSMFKITNHSKFSAIIKLLTWYRECSYSLL